MESRKLLAEAEQRAEWVAAGVALLVSEDLLKAAGEDTGAHWSLVRDAPIRGHREPVRIYTDLAGLNSP
ncbi:MAG TPA: hypothetical protein VGB90_07495 [Alphaproteobacteria bacterium]